MLNKNQKRQQEIGQQFANSRKEAKYTQDTLAAEIGIDVKTLGRFERGENNLGYIEFLEIAKILKISLDSLINGTQVPWYEAYRNMPLSEKLKSCRKYFGWTQAELAKQANIHRQTIIKIESSLPNIMKKKLSSLEKAMNLPSGFLS